MHEFILKLTNEDITVIANALQERPFKEVSGLVIKLNAQLIEQQKPKDSDQKDSTV